MRIVRSAAELGDAVLERLGPVYFVPTMGYFHEGHLSLMRMAAADRDADVLSVARKCRSPILQKRRSRAALQSGGSVVVSLFVNPTQFNDPNDLEAYPRDEERDAAMAEEAGCDLLYIPVQEEIYPEGFGGTRVHVPRLSEVWEGEYRPGHFDAVATVVAKLFHLVLPDYAYFGEKDWQQCKVVERMVHDLDFPVWLRFGETVREPDGLAMSSRNSRLRPEVRQMAAGLYRALEQVALWVREGQDPRAAEKEAERMLLSAGFTQVDYVAAVDAKDLSPIPYPLSPIPNAARVIAAAHIGGVRLIDNVKV